VLALRASWSCGVRSEAGAGHGAALAEVLSEQVATKHDINQLRAELWELEQRLVIKLGG
jgi:hypothetical protein